MIGRCGLAADLNEPFIQVYFKTVRSVPNP